MVGSVASVVEFGELDLPARNKISAKNNDILRKRQTPDDVKKGRPEACLALRLSLLPYFLTGAAGSSTFFAAFF